MTRIATTATLAATSRSGRTKSSTMPLQRKCACGGETGLDGTCEECGNERLQRKADGRPSAIHAPPIVHEVLRSPGQPLDPPTRAFFESHLAHDFGSVRVHADSHAGTSARAVGALAYTMRDHVVFAPGQFRPNEPAGGLLLGHELAHVVQQSAARVTDTANETGLEAEADRAAAAISAGDPATLLHRVEPRLLRQQAPQAMPPRAPSKQENDVIEAARRAAAIRTQIALLRVSGLVAPMGRAGSDPAAEMRQRAVGLARMMFDWENPNMERIGEVLSSMVAHLAGPEVMIAAANDPECGNRAAYVRGLRPPIVVCPTFFTDSAEQQIRTQIHEAAHLARIGNATLGESYCMVYDCQASCGGFGAADSWAHFIHCLTDQMPDRPTAIQGQLPAGGAEQSRAAEAPAGPKLDFASIAQRVHEAMAGWGTDEEGVYRALQELDRDSQAIKQLMKVYQAQYGSPLIEEIRDEFSGTELQYALQLLNLGDPESAQRIDDRGPLADPEAAAERIREAVEGAGTDEEAVYAALLPFKRDTLDVQKAYQERYHEDLRDRIVDEMSGSELEYALSLLETPYEHYLQEGNARLAGAPFGSFGDVRMFCTAEERQMSSGIERTYWYDREYWEPGREIVREGGKEKLSCKVTLLPGKGAAEAIDQMFDHQDRWKIACAEFVQIVHLYALRHTLGAKRFDATVSQPLTLEIRRRESTGIQTEVVFTRETPGARVTRSDIGQFDPRSVDAILATAPIGSRVRWTNLAARPKELPVTSPRPVVRINLGQEEERVNAWENENTIKLGPDKFGAHGTATGIFTKDNTHTRAEVELETARGTNPKADAAYVQKNIFISEIEFFKEPIEP